MQKVFRTINITSEHFQQQVITDDLEETLEKYHLFVELFQLTDTEQLQILGNALDSGIIFMHQFVEMCRRIDEDSLLKLIESLEIDSYQYKCVIVALFIIYYENKALLYKAKIGRIHDERILEDLEYLLSLDWEDDILYNIVVVIEKSRRGIPSKESYEISSDIARLLLSVVDYGIINKVFLGTYMGPYNSITLTRRGILLYIFDNYTAILTNKVLEICCRASIYRQLSSECLITIQERLYSDNICLDLIKVSNMKNVTVENIYYVTRLFKTLDNHDDRMRILNLVIRSKKFSEANELINSLKTV